MTMTSARFALPYLQPGQAQKEVFHNEALTRLDLALHAAVEAVALNTPPSSPALGACWVVGAAPSGDWSGHAGALAGWTAGGWRFVAGRPGMTVWSIADACTASWDGASWQIGDISGERVLIGGEQVVAGRQAAIAAPTGGTVTDAEARGAIAAILSALAAHGLIHA